MTSLNFFTLKLYDYTYLIEIHRDISQFDPNFQLFITSKYI